MALSRAGRDAEWRLHATVPRSAANGPGVRFVVWAQGCSLGCAGCFNPETHGGGGQVRRVGDVLDEVLATTGIDGVTLTGGEPLEQPGAVAAFVGALRARSELGVVILTGYSAPEIHADPAKVAAVAGADMVVAGRYNRLRHVGAGLRGSANKEYWALTGRYSPADFAAVPEAEIVVAADGTLTMTGMWALDGVRA